MDSVLQDVRYAIRQVARRPGFSLLVALTLSVGIGANVAIFSVLKGLILRTLPYPEPERVVAIWETAPEGRYYQPFTPPDYFDMREQNSTFEEMGVFRFNWVNLAGEGEPTRNFAVRGTASTMRALGVQPAFGRLFTDDEDIEGAHQVAILSDELWRRQFGGDGDIVGQRITIDGQSYAVVGVMPDDFEFPRPWSQMTQDPELWIPLPLSRADSLRNWHYLASVGRLKDDVTVEQAEADLRNIAASLAELYPNTNSRVQVWIDPLMRRSLGYVQSFLIILLVVVGLVLLIACANVAAMLLARGTNRMTELAIRGSMGARRGRLIRQLLTESMILSVMGGAFGVLLAFWGVDALKGRIPAYIPRVEGVRVDGEVLLYAVLVVLVTGLIFGLIPALFGSRTDLVGALREGRGSQASGLKHNRILGALVAGQLAMAFVLVNGAGLLVASYVGVFKIPRGFDTTEVMVVGISVNGPGYEETAQRVAFFDQLLERVAALPGVEYAAAANKIPMRGGNNFSLLVEGQSYDQDVRRPLVEISHVSPDYFHAMGIALQSGRLLDERDRGAPGWSGELNLVVNQAFADHYWPGERALGRRLLSNSAEPVWTATIVGIVENVPQWGVVYPALPEIYTHHSRQLWTETKLIVRAAGDPLALVPGVRQALRGLDSQIPLANIRTMGEELKRATQRRRFFMTLVSLFAVTALVLAIAGTYGVMSYYVSRRTHEVGVRVAMGASSLSILRLFLLRGLRLVGIGVVIGVAVAMASAVVTSSWLFGVSPFSPLFLAGGALFMTAVAMAAISVPVFRATRVDPNEALRAE